MVRKRNHPTFKRTNYGRSRRARVKDNWRRPRGIDNKQREKYKYMGRLPSIGYGNPSEIKHLHPSGLKEVIVENVAQLAGLKDVVIRIAGSVGQRKADKIAKAAQEAKLRVLNYKKIEPKQKTVKKDKLARAMPSEKKDEKVEKKEETAVAHDEKKPQEKTENKTEKPATQMHQEKHSHDKFVESKSEQAEKTKREKF